MTKIYHNPRCSKSRDALRLLESSGVEFEVIKYLDEAPSSEELSRVIKMLGIKPEQLVRKKEKLFNELGLSEKQLSDKQWLQILSSNPKLIERPIVVHKGNAAIGRPTENIAAILD